MKDSSVSSSDVPMDIFLKTKKNTSTLFPPRSVTCVYGKSGIGKTYRVIKELPNHVIVDHSILKNRQTTLDFFERLKLSSTAIIIDNWESLSDLIGIREITGPVSQGPLIIIAHTPVELTPDTKIYACPILSVDEIARIAPEHPRARELAEECRGDVRAFIRSLEFQSDTPDAFKTPREIVDDLLISKHPIVFLNKTLHEHGYVHAMLQENYIDTKGISIDTCADIIDSMSMADIYDTAIYADGSWDALMPFFIFSGCIIPAYKMKQKIDTKKLRAGSMWTKYQNMCMRQKKIEQTRLQHDALTVIRKYIEHGMYSILDDYNLDTSAVDVMNHIVVGQKLKPKIVELAKRHVRLRTDRKG